MQIVFHSFVEDDKLSSEISDYLKRHFTDETQQHRNWSGCETDKLIHLWRSNRTVCGVMELPDGVGRIARGCKTLEDFRRQRQATTKSIGPTSGLTVSHLFLSSVLGYCWLDVDFVVSNFPLRVIMNEASERLQTPPAGGTFSTNGVAPRPNNTPSAMPSVAPRLCLPPQPDHPAEGWCVSLLRHCSSSFSLLWAEVPTLLRLRFPLRVLPSRAPTVSDAPRCPGYVLQFVNVKRVEYTIHVNKRMHTLNKLNEQTYTSLSPIIAEEWMIKWWVAIMIFCFNSYSIDSVAANTQWIFGKSVSIYVSTETRCLLLSEIITIR
jgi:hypothetical protein